MLVKSVGVLVGIEVDDPNATTLDINSPTLPAAALSFVVVPIMPDVLENVKLVALGVLKIGVPVKVGLAEPTKLPVPVEPDRPTPTWFTVAIISPYATVSPVENV
jgi:hypothetical protein